MESVSDFLKRKAKGETQREDPVRDFLRKKAGAEDAGAYTPGVGKSGKPGVTLTPQPSKEPETPAQTGRLRPGWSVNDVVEAAEKTPYQKAVESEDNTSRTHLSGRFGETKTSEDKTPSTHLSGRVGETKTSITKDDVIEASNNYDKARANSFGASMALGAALTVRGQNPLSDSMPDVQAWANSAIAKAQAAKAAEQDALAQFNTIAERYQEQERERKYDALRKNPEFAAKSKGDEETAREAASKMATSGAMAAYYQIYHRNDPVKTTEDLMTGLGASLLGGELNRAQQPNYTAGNDLSFIRDDEADTFFYLWNTQGPKAASTYLDSIRSDLNARRNTEQEKLTIQYAQEHPVKASAESVLQNQFSIAGVVDLTVQNLRRQFGDKTKPIDYNTPAQDFGKTTQRIRDTVGKSLEEQYPEATVFGITNLASFLYQTGMSMADSGVQLIMNRLGVPQPVTLSLMAGGAAQQAVYDAKRRGASDGQALLFGYASGIAEYAFEKMSLDNLVNNVVEKTGASIGTKLTEKWLSGLAQKVTAGIIDVGTQSLVEGSEELFTSLANTVSDIMINQDKAELFANIQHYINNGVDPQVASKMVIKDWVNGLIADTLGGLISGVGMGGTGTALRAVANYGSDVGQAAVAAVQAARQDLSERNAPAPVEAPAQAEAPVPVEAPAPVSALQAAVDKLTAGQQLSEKDAKAIMNDPQSMQTLRDAGMPESLRPGAEGRAQVRQAVEQYAAQEAPQTAQETQEPQPADITPAGEAPRTQGLRLPTAQETLTPAPQKVNLLAQNRTEVTNNGQTEAPAPAPEAGTVRNAPAEQSFAERARAAAETERSRAILDRSERRTSLGRFLQNYREIRAQQRADQQFASQKQRADQLQHQADARNLTYTSAAELGVTGGTEKSTMQVIPQDMLDRDQLAAKQAAARDGVDLQFVLGQGEALDDNGAAYNFRGWISADGKRMIVQADHSKLTWQQILSHEELHKLIKSDPEYRRMVESALLVDKKLQPYLGGIVDRYVAAYHDMQVFDENEIIEEMLADYRAGFDMLDIYHGVAGNVAAKKTAAKDIRAAERGRAAQVRSTESGQENVIRASNGVTLDDDIGASNAEIEAEANQDSFSRELDPDTLDRLNSEPTITVYRAMQVVDGKLYPPMAAKVSEDGGKRQWVEPTDINTWYRSDEHPELIDANGKFVLDKGNGSSLKAAYNPYFHTSNMMLNDQFSSAWDRDNLVVVEASIPESELTSGYRAEGAKDPVGEMNWHSGPVASKLKGDKARRVTLSRWVRINRIVPNTEVAQSIAKLLNGENISIPENTITPSLKAELEKQGVQISPATGNAAKSKMSRELDANYLAAVEAGDMETAQRMVDEAAKKAMPDSVVRNKKGNLQAVYHGTKSQFYTFKKGDLGYHFGNKSTATARVGSGKDSKFIKAYLNITNPIEFDVDFGSWDADYRITQELAERGVLSKEEYRRVHMRSTEAANRELVKILKEKGYDGIIYKNYFESNGSTSYIAFDPTQIKSADPVTYDDNGNVIPLSERFNTEEPDIRYSREIDPDEAARAETRALQPVSPGEYTGGPRSRGRSTNPRKKVSRVRTHAFELGGLYNEVEAQMAENQPGEFTYDPVSEKRSMNKALGRLKKDFAGEAEKLASSDQWGGSDVDTAMGILYQYRQIGRETGDYSLFNDWSHVIQQKGTKGGQFVQAFAKYSRTATGVAQKAAENLRDQHTLTPAQQKRVEGHVNELMRAVDDFAEEAARGSVEDARGAKKGLKLPRAKQQYGDTQKAKDAMNVVKEIYDIFSRKTRRDHGAPVEDWTKLTGDQLASRIASRFNSENKQRTTMQTILDDLLTYASEHALPKREGKTPRTATERITDYLNNREAYGEAWSEAKQVLREMYADDHEKLDALEAFLNSTISYNGEDLDQTMFRAILESADALGLTKDDILKLTAAGVNEGTIDRITEEFLRRIGSDDANLRDTVARHITNLVMADNQEGRLGRMENDAAKELDLKLQNLLRESKQTKSSAANAIARYLINDLGISGTDAAIAADHIASHYMERIESKAAQTLEKMFAEKGERVKPEQRDRLMDLIHLGGLTNANVEDAVVDALGIGKLSRAQQRQIMDAMAQFADTLDAIENDDLEGLRQLIRLQAAARGTKLSSLTEEILSGETDAEYLRDFATTQLRLIAADYDARSAGEKISTLQIISHLLNARTAMRNVTSNQIFDLVDSTANNVGLLSDIILSKITGQRTVGFEKSWASQAKRQGAMKGMGRSILEVSLDVDPDGRNKSKYGTGGRRTFSMASSGTVGRILSKAEEIMGYELNTTDEFHKGSVYAETLESLGRFVDAGYMTEEEAAEFAAQEALYRSFQDDTKMGAMLAGLKDVLNIIGTGKTSGKTIRGLPVHDFGLGDLVVKYTQVPGALIHRAIEFSPVGYIKAIYNIAQLGNVKSRGESTIKQQRNAALALGRATTGSGLIMLFTLLAKLGLLRRGDDEKDKNAAALKNSQGLSGTQINLTAISRLLSGESAEPQRGDVLHDIGFLEPLDSLMTIAALINNDPEIKNLNLYEMFRSAETAKKLVGKSLQGIWLALEDTSAMQTLSNIYSTIRYHDEENDLPLYMQIPMEIASSSISGFIPAPIRQIAQATDTTYRDQYRSQDLLKQTGARVANAIPGLRKQLAPKLTPLGEDKTYQEPWLNALNALVNPGNISVYQTDKARDELLRVYEETGEGSMLPARNAPYSINIGGESYTLTPDERTEYLRIRGQEETKFVESLLTANWYRNADADTKAAFLNSAKNIANDIAKSQWAAERGITYHDTTYRGYLKMLTEGTRYADVIKAANEDLADTVEAGIPRQVWDATKAAFNDIANSDISSYEKGVQQRALISDLEDLDNRQKLLVYGDLANADSRVEQFRTVMDAGLNFDETAKIFDQYSAYKSEDDTRASQDAKDFALWVDQRKDLTSEQKKVVKEQFKYWQMIPAEAERYEKYTGMGFTPEAANRIDSALSGLQPLPGHDGVTDMQRTKAAIGALGKNASKSDQMKIVESFYGGSTTTKSGELSQWGKIKKVTSSGVTVDKTLKLIDDGSLDEYVNWMDWSKDVTPERKVDSNVYIKFQKTYNSTSSTYDETTGKAIKGQEKKDKVMAYIDGLNLTIDQKDGLYLTRYKESGLKDTPWHKGGGGSGKGKTYAPAKLRLPTVAERTSQTIPRLQLPSAPAAKPTTGGLKLR